jgi:hypothetical protein
MRIEGRGFHVGVPLQTFANFELAGGMGTWTGVSALHANPLLRENSSRAQKVDLRRLYVRFVVKRHGAQGTMFRGRPIRREARSCVGSLGFR